MNNSYCVYIILCGGDYTWYVGIAKDPHKRFKMHAAGKGARYTRGRGPLYLSAYTRFMPHGEALRFEAKVKRMKSRNKLKAILGESK